MSFGRKWWMRPARGMVVQDAMTSVQIDPRLDADEYFGHRVALSDEDRRNVEGYLAEKWGLQHRLPKDPPEL